MVTIWLLPFLFVTLYLFLMLCILQLIYLCKCLCGYICLTPDLRGNAFSFFSTQNIGYWPVIYIFYNIRV